MLFSDEIYYCLSLIEITNINIDGYLDFVCLQSEVVFREKRYFSLYKIETKQNYNQEALPLGLQSDEEIDIKSGKLAIAEGPEMIKCELGKT